MSSKEIDSNCFTFTGMDCTYSGVDISKTGYFSNIINDYLKGEEKLSPFYVHSPDIQGISESLKARAGFKTDRKLLVDGLKAQYSFVQEDPVVSANIDKLLLDTTYTIVTAHQPAIFTGTLYFVYKILHAVALCNKMKELHPENDFVPVYYMGSEDADLDELGQIYLSGDTIRWETKQEGAVGRMRAEQLDPILNRIEGELSVLPFGKELISLLKDCYHKKHNIQEATFKLLHELFGKFGVVVFMPDQKEFKKALIPVFKKDLFDNLPFEKVSETITLLEKNYKVQANPRQINLFYFGDGRRDRIEKSGDNEWTVVGTDIKFNREELEKELNEYPERFSPNVILRGLMQETLLPNLAYVGGGGELAYWMEYRTMFETFEIPFPALILRKSFLLIEDKYQKKINRLGLNVTSLFHSQEEIMTEIVNRNTESQLTLVNEIEEISKYYDRINYLSGSIDATLEKHVASLKVRAIKALQALEKKMLRAEKRKFSEEQQMVESIKKNLFPKNNLQERVENFMPWYSKYGPAFFDELLKVSLEEGFGVIQFKEN
jgi:bacillithiol synthase